MELQLKILAVDDEAINLQILVDLLGHDYKLAVAKTGAQALNLIAKGPLPDLILLDVMMPEMDGYEVCRRLKAQKQTQEIPIIFVTAMSEERNETQGFEMGAVDYITKPYAPAVVKARIKTHLDLKQAREMLRDQNLLLEQLVQERTRELAMTQDATIHSLASLAETRDPETGGHIRRTQHYVKALAQRAQQLEKYQSELSDEVLELLFKSAPLHDIGKVGVRDSVLLKPGKLTEEEFEEMKMHTIYGRDALLNAARWLNGSSNFLQLATEIAHTHQEKWDGSGYPQGLVGEQIPLSGRIMAIADVYDALISKRAYKAPFSHQEAVTIIKEGRGSHFDPELTDAFLEISEQFQEIAGRFSDELGLSETKHSF